MDTPTHDEIKLEAVSGFHGLGLPAHLAALVNPEVLAEREKVIEARLRDEGRTRVLRRRCAEIIVNHLLQEVADDDA